MRRIYNNRNIVIFLGILWIATLGFTQEAPDQYRPRLELEGPAEPMADRFIERVPEIGILPTREELKFAGFDVSTSDSVRRLSLRNCVSTVLEQNRSLQKARLDVDIIESRLRESEAYFIPFVELVGAAAYSESRIQEEDPLSGDDLGRRRITRNDQEGRVEVGQNFVTGGNLAVSAGSNRTRDGQGIGPDDGNLVYDTGADVRFNQPLLRGAGFEVGTADVRKSRLSQMNQEITYRLQQRDVVLEVIRQYFLLLQAGQELRVSRDAIAEKLRFLEETRIKYQRGRVAESEILRAELQYLQEEESHVRRTQTLFDRRERLVLLLGLDPGTPISVEDVSPLLAERGRYEIPPVEESVRIGLADRLELLQAEIAYERSRIDLQVARNNVLPNLDFTSGYTTSDGDTSLGGSTDLEDNMWDVGVEMRVPIPNIARREQRKRAQLSLQKVETDWENQEREITLEIKAAHRAVTTAESGLAILAKTVEQARKNLELINASFEVGFSTITEVRLAQDDLFAAQTRYNNTLLNYQIAIAQFYVAVGQSLQ